VPIKKLHHEKKKKKAYQKKIREAKSTKICNSVHIQNNLVAVVVGFICLLIAQLSCDLTKIVMRR